MTPKPSAQTHSMVRGRHEWYCTAKNPRCGFTVPLEDMGGVLAHTTERQPDLRHLPPLPMVVAGPVFGGTEDLEDVA